MRKIIKDACVLASLMILTVFAISIIWVGVTAEIKLVLMLDGLALIIATLNYFIDEFTSLTIIMDYIVKYFAISVIVMLFGFIVGWFRTSNFWMAFIYVGIVMVLAYCVDEFKIKRDIEYINNHIKDK